MEFKDITKFIPIPSVLYQGEIERLRHENGQLRQQNSELMTTNVRIEAEAAERVRERKVGRAAINNAQKERLRAITDYPTGLLNLDGMQEDYKLLRRQVGNVPTTALFIDIDHFGEINHRIGHLKANKVLRAIGGVFTNRLRTTDLAGRFGGDEFVVLLPSTTIEEAEEISGQLQLQIHTATKEIVEGGVTVSIGLDTADLTSESFEDSIEKANEALLRAKANGRNRIEIDGGHD